MTAAPTHMARVHGARWCFTASSDADAIAKAVSVGGAAPCAQTPPDYFAGGSSGPFEPPVYKLVVDPLDATKLLALPVNAQARHRGSERPFTIGEL